MMNELSWLIYAADVAGSVKTVAVVGSIAIGMGCALSTFGGLMICSSSWSDEDEKKTGRSLLNAWKKWVIAFSSLVAIASLTPSQSTIYAIAASEMGERVITSETGGKAVKALNAWLDKQVAGDTK